MAFNDPLTPDEQAFVDGIKAKLEARSIPLYGEKIRFRIPSSFDEDSKKKIGHAFTKLYWQWEFNPPASEKNTVLVLLP